MKRHVRNGVFETNSSSTHSICIATDLKRSDFRFPDKVTFRYGEFGWEVRRLDSMEAKASYLYTAIHHKLYESIDRWKECLTFIFETLKDNDIECSFEGFVKIEPWVSSYDGYSKLYFSMNIEDGYIDHGDETNDLVDALCSDRDLLLSFLFSKKSFILTGNDNDDEDVDINVDYEYQEFYKGN